MHQASLPVHLPNTVYTFIIASCSDLYSISDCSRQHLWGKTWSVGLPHVATPWRGKLFLDSLSGSASFSDDVRKIKAVRNLDKCWQIFLWSIFVCGALIFNLLACFACNVLFILMKCLYRFLPFFFLNELSRFLDFKRKTYSFFF